MPSLPYNCKSCKRLKLEDSGNYSCTFLGFYMVPSVAETQAVCLEDEDYIKNGQEPPKEDE